jgi:hypothetical protein
MEHRAVTAMPLGSSKNVFFKLRLHARGQVPAISVLPGDILPGDILPGDRYLADATTRSWLLFLALANTNTMLKHLGVGRAAGGEEPPKSEGGGSER